MTKHRFYAWLVLDKKDGKEGMLSAEVPGFTLAPVPLVNRNRDVVVNYFGPVAKLHERRTGEKVRMAVFEEVTEN